MRNDNRFGFTLTELVVVIAIIGILASLLFMAILRTRGNSRAMVCKNNLRQIGLAVAAYESAHKVFPAAHSRKHFSLHVSLLPWMGGESTYGPFAEFPPDTSIGQFFELLPTLPMIHGISSYRCPDSSLIPYLHQRVSKDSPLPDDMWDRDFDFTSYLACYGSTWALRDTSAAGLFSTNDPKRPPVRAGEVRRGLSNTLAVSEGTGLDRREYHRPGREHITTFEKGVVFYMNKMYSISEEMEFDCLNGIGISIYGRMVGNEWIEGGLPGNAFSTWLPPNSRSCYNKGGLNGAAITPSSHHGDWVHACFGDGSVRSISNHIDPTLFAESGRIALPQNQ